MTTDTVQAAVYCRISVAGVDDTTKTDDQERICRELAQRRGWDVHDVYTDHARSAWQPSRKRPGWNRMIGDVEAGKVSAIVVYHGDRLLRTQEDLLVLINLARTRSIKLASPIGERDLGNYDDQFILEIEASMAKRESANTSRRRKQQYQRQWREGRIRSGGRGGRAFGFETDGMTQVPAECAAYREAARRILAGEGLLSVMRDLNGRGLITTAGNPWRLVSFKAMLLRPRYAGLMPDGVSPGAWEQVIERAQWEALTASLAVRRGTQRTLTNRHRYLLSGIAACGAAGCGAPLIVKQTGPRPGRGVHLYYACRRPGCGKVGRSMTRTDNVVIAGVLKRMRNSVHNKPRVNVTDGVVAEMQALEQRRRDAEAIIENLADHPGQRLDVLARSLQSFDRRLADLRDRAAGDDGARVLRSHPDVTTPAEFRALSLAVQRTLVAAAFRVVILPVAHRGGPRFDPALIRLERHGEGDSGSGDAASGS